MVRRMPLRTHRRICVCLYLSTTHEEIGRHWLARPQRLNERQLKEMSTAKNDVEKTS